MTADDGLGPSTSAFPRPVPAPDLPAAVARFLQHPGPRLLLRQTVLLWCLRLR